MSAHGHHHRQREWNRLAREVRRTTQEAVAVYAWMPPMDSRLGGRYLERIPLGTPYTLVARRVEEVVWRPGGGKLLGGGGRDGAGSSRGHNGKSQIVWRNQPRKIGVTREPRMTARYAHVVDMTKKNPALFIPVKVK